MRSHRLRLGSSEYISLERGELAEQIMVSFVYLLKIEIILTDHSRANF